MQFNQPNEQSARSKHGTEIYNNSTMQGPNIPTNDENNLIQALREQITYLRKVVLNFSERQAPLNPNCKCLSQYDKAKKASYVIARTNTSTHKKQRIEGHWIKPEERSEEKNLEGVNPIKRFLEKKKEKIKFKPVSKQEMVRGISCPQTPRFGKSSKLEMQIYFHKLFASAGRLDKIVAQEKDEFRSKKKRRDSVQDSDSGGIKLISKDSIAKDDADPFKSL